MIDPQYIAVKPYLYREIKKSGYTEDELLNSLNDFISISREKSLESADLYTIAEVKTAIETFVADYGIDDIALIVGIMGNDYATGSIYGSKINSLSLPSEYGVDAKGSLYSKCKKNCIWSYQNYKWHLEEISDDGTSTEVKRGEPFFVTGHYDAYGNSIEEDEEIIETLIEQAVEAEGKAITIKKIREEITK